jgi:hypothetical protein
MRDWLPADHLVWLVIDVVDQLDLVIDYRVHYAGAKGPRRPKVFKLTRRRLEV